METEAKYYIPEIEELRVGFECEIQSSYGFQKGIFPEVLYLDTLSGFRADEIGAIEAVKSSNIRVKYLDSEDIESLGFIFNAGVTERTDRFSYKNFMLYFNREAKIVRIAEMNRQIVFQRAFPMGVELDYKELFNGTVKNKSKLKQVLKMIGVH